MTQEQQTGTVERLTDKGYGFIEIDGERKNVFFHATGVERGVRFDEIEEGDAVAFTLAQTDKGVAAVGVNIVGRPLASLPTWPTDSDDSYDWDAQPA